LKNKPFWYFFKKLFVNQTIVLSYKHRAEMRFKVELYVDVEVKVKVDVEVVESAVYQVDGGTIE
jgi:hypothetical protein